MFKEGILFGGVSLNSLLLPSEASSVLRGISYVRIDDYWSSWDKMEEKVIPDVSGI